MKAGFFALFAVVMVTMAEVASATNLLTEKRRYCGRHLVSSLLKACGIGRFSRTGDIEKRDITSWESNEIQDKLLSQQEALLELYHQGSPLSDVIINHVVTRDADKRSSLLPTHFLLEKCCKFGCSLMDMIGLCN